MALWDAEQSLNISEQMLLLMEEQLLLMEAESSVFPDQECSSHSCL